MPTRCIADVVAAARLFMRELVVVRVGFRETGVWQIHYYTICDTQSPATTPPNVFQTPLPNPSWSALLRACHAANGYSTQTAPPSSAGHSSASSPIRAISERHSTRTGATDVLLGQ